jgi:hypothetical protein
MRFERIEVETRDGYRTSQEPTAFLWRGRWYEVTEVLDRWHEGYVGARRVPMRYFRVRAGVEGVFVVRYHELFTAWSVLAPGTPSQEEDPA